MNSKTHDAKVNSTFLIEDSKATQFLAVTVQGSNTSTNIADVGSIQGPTVTSLFDGVDIDFGEIPDVLRFGSNENGGHYVDVASLYYSGSATDAAFEYLENGTSQQQAFAAMF
jgi:hypothetical protein